MSNGSLEQILKTNIEKIRKAKEQDKLVVFVGAGVSVNSKLPTWYDLVSELAEEMGMNVGNSVDSFMQIPQYYFNERGEKEYLEKIEGILNRKTYKPNIIHEQIIDLNPKHIITTNYDDLLEQSFKLYNKSYHVVSDNSDLPYASQDQMLIKMHGCLKKKNIVLKEDDYLSYSSNFKLIETYIKSLFSTHIILFIGYSAEDPNFKLIFQWVKDILNKDFQPAYLIDISEEFNLLKYNYYKNRGIHIIYSNNLEQNKEDGLEECKLENPKGKKLFNILKRINDIEEEHIVSRIYNNLREFENVNAVQPKDILKATGYNSEMVYENGLIRGVKIGGELYELLSNIKGIGKNKKEVNLFRKDLLSNYKQVLRYILSVLKKANIRGIKFFNEEIFYFTLTWCIDDIETPILKMEYNFDYKSMWDTLMSSEAQTGLEGNPADRMSDMFLSYKLNSLDKAYGKLRELSRSTFEDREFLNYYLVEFNKNHISGVYKWFTGSKNQKNNLNEMEIRDLDNLNLQMPISERKKSPFIQSILSFNFVYSNMYKSGEILKKLKNEKKLVERGGQSIGPHLSNLYNNTYNFWLFINNNYLIVEHYSDVKVIYNNFIEGMTANYSIHISDNCEDIQVNKLDSVDSFILYIMLSKIQGKELVTILDKYKVKEMKIDEEAREYLFNVFLNFIGAFVVKEIHTNLESEFENILRNFLVIFSVIDLNKLEAELILQNLSNLVSYTHSYDYFKYLNKFIKSLGPKVLSLKAEVVINFYSRLLQKVLNNSLTLSEYEGLKTSNVFYSLSKLNITNVEEKSAKLSSDLLNRLEFEIKYNLLHDINKGLLLIFSAMIPITDLVEEKKLLQEKFHGIMNSIDKQSLDSEGIRLLLLILHNAILTELFIKKEAPIKILEEMVVGSKGHSLLRELIFNNVTLLVSDYGVKRADIPELIWNLINKGTFEEFYFVPEYFDYNLFEINWLYKLTQEEIKSFSEIEEFHNQVRDVYNSYTAEELLDVDKELLLRMMTVLVNA
ncbi:hypothetical protein COE95_14275 [Bacillus toyonensis]|uniref:SIR2 family protein n=1 Tax=Bacillus toyonensis TaxID=155322 RepID=UPI000BF63C19|nr:SIR2 family protein [Bacillus toyonensis]PEP91683.1 hypothetical protein CN583_13945 [Bacillus toyonensis]PHC30908.1 hypothetical protein COE95_14275 [Bacillus toyonensis]PHC56248.1 hypothetical protein COF08_02665 [Bacillus toyonensis]HDX9610335.1 SIR2 family protein [Bacillus toyonensis]